MSDSSHASLTRAVDLRHEPDRFVGPAGFNHRVADQHLDYAGLHDVHAGARVVLVEHNAPGRIGHARSCPLGKHPHIDFIAVHIHLVVSIARERKAYAKKLLRWASFHSSGGSTILGLAPTPQPARPDARPAESGR